MSKCIAPGNSDMINGSLVLYELPEDKNKNKDCKEYKGYP